MIRMIGIATKGDNSMEKLTQSESHIPISRDKFRKDCIAAGGTRKDADKAYRDAKKQETWVNDLYVIQIDRNHRCGFGNGPDGKPVKMTEIAIRRRDREPIRDWRHFQAIKNQLVGPNHEGCELYPSEKRLRDGANQYWLYVFNEPEIAMPFGMFGRAVDDKTSVGPSKQRPLDSDKKKPRKKYDH